MKITLGLLVFCSVFVFAKADTGKGNKSNDVKQNSTFFKMSRNSNRLALFEQLQGVIKIKASKTVTNGSLLNQYSNYQSVVDLLGEPNVKVKKSTIIYTLNPEIGCKAIIEFDNDGYAVYVGIKDCR